jgi:acyl carrier protein
MFEIREQIVTLLACVLDLPVDDIPPEAAPGVVEKWDSLKHMMLILALEEEFDVRFTDDELTDLLSLELIVHIVSEKIGGVET